MYPLLPTFVDVLSTFFPVSLDRLFTHLQTTFSPLSSSSGSDLSMSDPHCRLSVAPFRATVDDIIAHNPTNLSGQPHDDHDASASGRSPYFQLQFPPLSSTHKRLLIPFLFQPTVTQQDALVAAGGSLPTTTLEPFVTQSGTDMNDKATDTSEQEGKEGVTHGNPTINNTQISIAPSPPSSEDVWNALGTPFRSLIDQFGLEIVDHTLLLGTYSLSPLSVTLPPTPPTTSRLFPS